MSGQFALETFLYNWPLEWRQDGKEGAGVVPAETKEDRMEPAWPPLPGYGREGWRLATAQATVWTPLRAMGAAHRGTEQDQERNLLRCQDG